MGENDYSEILNRLKNENSDSSKNNSITSLYVPDEFVQFLEISKPGKYFFRMFRNIEDATALPYEMIMRHWWNNPKNLKKKAVFKCAGKFCPMCKIYQEHLKIKDPNAWAYSPQKVWIAYGLAKNGKITLLTLDDYAKEELKKFMIKQYYNKIDVLDFDHGKWIELEIYLNQDKKKKYSITMHDNHKATTQLKQKLLELTKLKDFYTNFTPDQLLRIIKGQIIDQKELAKNNPNRYDAKKEQEKVNQKEENIKKDKDIDKILTAHLPETSDAAREFSENKKFEEFLAQKDMEKEKIQDESDIIDEISLTEEEKFFSQPIVENSLLDEIAEKPANKPTVKRSKFQSLYSDDEE